MAKQNWIADVIAKNPGSLTRTARRAGKTTAEFMAHPPESMTTLTKRRVALAKTLKKLRKRKKAHS